MKKYFFLLILTTGCLMQCDIESIGVPVLIAPADGSTVTENPPTFIWQRVAGADLYGLEVAVDGQFNVTSLRVTCYLDTTYTPADPLVPGVYYWHVRSQEGD